MPELPEVETIRNSLADRLQGRKIMGVQMLNCSIVKAPDSALEFEKIIIGKSIEYLSRRGKYLLVYLTQNYVLVIHLRMTGRLIYTGKQKELAKHTHIVLDFDNGYQLRFIDVRRFGTIHLLSVNELDGIGGLASLGPEPLGKDFDERYLGKKLKGKTRGIKQLLLDQKIIAGLGNIYADEVLFDAAILPTRPGSSLNSEEVSRLYNSIVRVIKEAIDHRGTSFKDYVDGSGLQGKHQEHLMVYQKNGQLCMRCSSVIKKERIAGRSSHFCSTCQK